MALAVAEAHRVLANTGWLLDLHPNDEPAALEVWEAHFTMGDDGQASVAPEHLQAVQRHPLGELEGDPEILRDFAFTNDALAEALELGFEVVHSGVFDYYYSFDSVDELNAYLEDNWEQASANDALLERAVETLARAAPTAKLMIVQKVVITLLKKF